MRSALLILIFLLPVSASAQLQCGGSLEQSDFHDQMKSMNAEIQKNIIDYRTLERDLKGLAEGTPERAKAEARKKELWAELQVQKGKFKELNSPDFPKTEFSVYGAACNDRRWVGKAKDILVEKPEQLGKHFHVWMDAKTREVKVALNRPQPQMVAR